MRDTDRLDRRRVLAGVGAVGVATLAGCLDAFDDDGPEDGESGDRTVALGAHIPQSALQTIQQDISERVESGELSQQEAQTEYAQRERDLVVNTTNDVQSWLDDEQPVTVEDTLAEQSLITVTAGPEALLDLLDSDRIAAIVPEENVQEPDASVP